MATDLAKQENHQLLTMLNDERVMKRFEQAAGKHAGQVVVNIINAANANPEIYQCEPSSVITAALNAATMNLSLSPAVGQAAILPFNKSKKVGNEWQQYKIASLVVMKRGIKELAMRTNKYRVLNVFRVYEGQSIEEEQMTGKKKIVGTKQSDEVIGYGGYLVLFNGYEAVTYWTVEQIQAHAQRYSPTFNQKNGSFGNKSPWVTDFDRMAQKTVMKDLVINHGVISIEDRATLETVDESLGDAEMVDGEMTDLPTEDEEEVQQPTAEEKHASAQESMEMLFGDQ